ncbi:MAG: PIN domain-containing protein [Elusimicrobiota bacterium]
MILLDTNVLVKAWATQASGHEEAKRVVAEAAQGELKACVSAQNLWEFFSVITNPKKFDPPVTAKAALDIIDALLATRIKVIMPTVAAMQKTLELLKVLCKTRGVEVFDVFLAATALEHGVKEIYTQNTKDFVGIPGLAVRNPFS